ncbi:hypothetical protein ASJ33_00990 [Dehalococcoides mccartyi]|jgi:hypothetical protein|uniref:hypothetical protein n=1 Tax=Dehalococcoides mccartyi TaxID=61435 RepID=UPI0004E056B8|nr:hypothetical protein [Dehalococcoides mccartyi]AII58661.1 hypothetical protein X792_00650 [Dehalococcoides mccartyi CG1]APH11824.1 hypothetical protein ASJ33_00990 [Dehalococcoides mccartyi]
MDANFYTSGDQGKLIKRIKINENEICSNNLNDYDNNIRIPFIIENNPEFSSMNIYFTPLFFNVNLKIYHESKWVKISETSMIYNNNACSSFDVPLSEEKLNFIENQRKGKNIEFILDISCILAVGGAGYTTEIASYLHSTVARNVAIVLSLPKSIWEERVLSGLGLENLYSVTIQIPNNFKQEFSYAITELTRAVKIFETADTEEDYKNIIVHSRKALEAVVDKLALKLHKKDASPNDNSFSAKIKTMQTQILMPTIGEDNSQRVAKILTTLWGSFSGANHPGEYQCNRSYARFAIHQSASILSLLSEII